MSKKPRRQIVADPHKVFDHACRFWATDEQVLRNKNAQHLDIHMVAHPSMVLNSLAIELLIKCILLIEGKTVPDSHHLAKLYRQISHKRQRRIDELWEAHGRPYLVQMAQKEAEHGNKMPTDLGNSLVICSAAFERLRYAYENDYQNVRFWLGDLPRILRNVILETHPGWGRPSILPTFPHR